ncbi:toll/interleukin-1 receptor domain-containing protein [Asanoa siamensis]|nr:TIR domain-containing protein [Asanoa siamensis]
MADESPRYDVALSFAGENRLYVDAVAAHLRNASVRVFYDDYEKTALWGKDLYSHLDYVYRKASRYCVLFISKAYAQKVWTNHERRSAQARALEENGEYVLPARFDDTEVEGLRPTIGYLDLKDISPDVLAARIVEKLGPRPVRAGFPHAVDRLWDLRGIPHSDSGERERVQRIAYSFYDALGRMTADERRAVGGVFAFGCDAELPAGVHISLDLLHRVTALSKAELVDLLGAVRTLNVRVKVRDLGVEHEVGELVPDDKDLFLSFWSAGSDDSTEIAHDAVMCSADHFCADHGLEVIASLDFHRLSSAAPPYGP